MENEEQRFKDFLQKDRDERRNEMIKWLQNMDDAVFDEMCLVYFGSDRVAQTWMGEIPPSEEIIREMSRTIGEMRSGSLFIDFVNRFREYLPFPEFRDVPGLEFDDPEVLQFVLDTDGMSEQEVLDYAEAHAAEWREKWENEE